METGSRRKPGQKRETSRPVLDMVGMKDLEDTQGETYRKLLRTGWPVQVRS